MKLESNRRASIRKPIKMPACFKLVGVSTCDCVIEDYCFGGFYISYSDDVSARLSVIDCEKRMPLSLTFTIADQCYQLTSYITHQTDKGMGLYLEDMPKEVFSAFQNYTTKQNNHELHSDQHHLSSSEFERVKSDLYQNLLKGLSPLMSQYFNELPEELWKVFDKMPANRERTKIQDCITQLESNKNQLAQGFANNLDKKVKQFFNNERIEAPIEETVKPSIQELSMVNHDEFDVWLAVKVCAQRLEGMIRHELYLFTERLSILFGEIDKNCPLLPTGLVVIFKESMEGYLKDKRPRELMFAFLMRTLSDDIVSLYKVMNECLKNSAHLEEERSNRKSKVQHPGSQTRTQSVKGVSDSEQGVSDSEQGVSQTPETAEPSVKNVTLVEEAQNDRVSASDLKAVNQLASESIDVSKKLIQQLKLTDAKAGKNSSVSLDGGSEVLNIPLLGMDEIHHSVYETQYAALKGVIKVAESEGLENADFKCISMSDQLNDISRDNPDKAINLEPKEAAKIIDFVFDHLVCHDMLNAPIRQLLNQLRIPYYRVFLENPDLFDNAEHPAREVLDCFAKFGLKGFVWDKKIRKLVVYSAEKIMGSNALNVSLFEEILKSFKSVIDNNETLYLKNVVRLLETFKGREAIDSVRKKNNEFLAAFLTENKMQLWMNELLQSGWYKLLELSFIRKGEDSKEYQMAKSVITELHSRVVNKKSTTEMDDYALVGLVKEGLSKIVSKRGMHARCIKHLQDMLFKEDNYLILSDLVEPDYLKQFQVKIKDENHFGESSRVLRNLKVGDWVEFPSHPEATQKTRVAAISEDKDRFLFVNNQGVKALESSHQELANQIENGRMIVTSSSDIPVVEQGLSYYVDNIYQRIQKGSLMDSLTGLPDRTDLEKRLKAAINDYHSKNVEYTAVYFNFDAFGMINKACGYQAGDLCLKRIALELTFHLGLNKRSKGDAFRDGEVKLLARVSGNTFCYLAPIAKDQAYKAADDLLQKINSFRFKWESNKYELQASVGVFTFTPDTLSPDTVLHCASFAMLQAQSEGGNKIHVFDEKEDKETQKRREIYTWVAHIDQAIKKDRLFLRGQPIYPVNATGDNEKPYYEILLGLVSDSGQKITLSEYLTAAEKYNRISKVDQWVVSETIKWLNQRPVDEADIAGVNINLSGSSLNDYAFMNFLFNVLKDFRGSRSMLNFEITETAAVNNIKNTRDFMNEMRQMGCHFWLDDFGAGMSSYVYLKQLPIEFLKIDGSFVRQISDDDRDLAIVRSIVDISRAMDVRVVAESVENEAALQLVKDLGVDFVQGYYVGKEIILKTDNKSGDQPNDT